MIDILDDILDKFGRKVAEKGYMNNDFKEARQALEKAVATHDTEKKQQLLKAIGEDEEEKSIAGDPPITVADGNKMARNYFRTELRQAVEKVYGDNNEQ